MPTTPSQHSEPSSRRDRRAARANVRWGREVPEAIRSLGMLDDADYADIVTATIGATPSATTPSATTPSATAPPSGTPPSRTPDELVQAGLSGLPRGLLVFVPFVQRVFLGLRVKLRPSPDRLLGWKVADRGENWMRVEASSWFLTARVVMHVHEGEVSFASFVRYDRWPAAFIWPLVSLIHRQVALALVRSAVDPRD